MRTLELAREAEDPARLGRTALIAVIAFLTLVDLFAMQAILPTLIAHYGVSPAAMGVAVNASTIGMALSSLAISCLGARVDRRSGIAASLLCLSVPTALLAVAPDLASFTALRVLQGVFMAAAFTLTLAHLGERYAAPAGASVVAAYIAGNVASNFVGRLMSAALADHFGLATAFFIFAAMNVGGGVLVLAALRRAPPMPGAAPPAPAAAALAMHLKDARLRATFGLGFLILFAFIGAFTYVNLVLTAPPIGLSSMDLGLVYFVFAPSIATTLWAGGLARRLGVLRGGWLALGIAAAGLPLLVTGSLPLVLAGLTLFDIGTFAAQAIATGHVGRIATRERGAASGLYLASYFTGGLAGSVVLGLVFDRFGWVATVAAIGVALTLAALLTARMAPAER